MVARYAGDTEVGDGHGFKGAISVDTGSPRLLAQRLIVASGLSMLIAFR